ncbi:MAG: NAD(P)H-binding protein [Flavobacteriales bacterium]|nr:NAD(P)H-binding protein [Flavobacteriales bacterium]
MVQVSVLGATGLVGRHLMNELVANPAIGRIQVWSRRPVHFDSDKVEVVVADLYEIQQHDTSFLPDGVFCCIGTTNAKAPDEETYRAIDYGIPVSAACKARREGVEAFAVISSIGANATAQPFYLRTKGQMELDVLKHGPRRKWALRPSFLLGERSEKRLGESIGKFFIRLFGPLLFGSWKKYRGIHAREVAKAMITLVMDPRDQYVWESNEIKDLAALYPSDN